MEKNEFHKIISNPIFTSIIISIISTLAISSGGWIYEKITGIPIVIPIWIPLVLCLIILFIIVFLIETRSNRKKVFVILPSFHEGHFYSSVLQSLINKLDNQNIDVVVKTHDGDFNCVDQSKHFREILEGRYNYVAGIVVPIKLDDQSHHIQEFVNNFRKPIIFLDIKPFSDPAAYPENAWFIGFKNKVGGELAANELCKLLQIKKIESPKILIICGSAQTDRQYYFIEHISNYFPKAAIEKKDGQFQRKISRDITIQFFDNYTLGSPSPFNAIFCTSDEMALGALDAILSLKTDLKSEIDMISYDGLKEAQSIIIHGNTVLKNSVVQDIELLTDKAIQTLIHLLENNKKGIQKENMLDPHLLR